MTKIYEEYMNYHNEYSKKYPEYKILVLMQVGKFYESYSIGTKPDLDEISNIIGVIKTKKGKEYEVSLNHPYCLGFPMTSRDKYCEILLDHGYLVVIIDQVFSTKSKEEKRKGGGEERQVTNIFTKGTFIQNIDTNEGNYIICVYISRDFQKNSNPLFSAGMTSIDVSTGHVYVHEACSDKYDEYYALDEVDRFITSLSPKEIIIYFENNGKDKSDNNFKKQIMDYLRLDDGNCIFFDTINKKYANANIQNEILKNIYPKTKSLVSPLEQLDLEQNVYCNVSLTILLDSIYDKNKHLLMDISLPTFFINDSHLTLGNNAISQLDVIERNKDNSGTGYKSLFHVVNNTSTALGERFLRDRLLSPLIEKNKLNELYHLTQLLINNNTYKQLENHLKNIRDIERLQKKVQMKLLKPVEISHLLSSYSNINNLVKYIQTNKELKDFEKIIPSKKSIENFKKLEEYINSVFILEELEKYVNLDIETQIFKQGIHEDIDNLSNSSDQIYEHFNKICSELNKILNAKKPFVSLKKTTKKGYYFKLTNAKAKMLRNEMEKNKINIKVDNEKYSISDFKIVEMGGENSKMTLSSFEENDKYDDPVECKEKLIKLNRKYYTDELLNIYNKFKDMFMECNFFISNIDFIKSSAKTAVLYGYSKPKILSKHYGYVKAKKLRHPIIERLIGHEYVPHDVELGNDLKGMMIYGLNSTGKSSVMKAVGLSIILAQSGLFVPCDEFELSPYNSLYTRITGDDNIFRGLSSFSLEMVELNAILKRANKKTLVIGDEVCRGTEHISGNSLVASAIVKLSKVETSFIFASHLHEIMEFEEVKSIDSIKAFHLSVTYDEKKGLIFDRTMKPGCGEKVYGVTVASNIIQDKEFIDMAIKFRNKLMESYDGILSGKTSKYNKNVLVYECSICKSKDKIAHVSNLETHHINFQKDCENGLVKGKKHLRKNDEANLIVLCNECHDKIHNGSLILEKYVMTSEGKTILIKEKEENNKKQAKK